MPPSDNPDILLHLVPWTLERLLGREYDLTLDSDGRPQNLELNPAYGVVPVETMENDLRATDVPKLDALFALRDGASTARVREVLEGFPFLRFQLAPEELERLSHATWPEILGSVYWGFRRFGDDTLRWVISTRLGLGGANVAYVETEMQWRRPEALPDAATKYVTRELGNLFPSVVERLRTFQIIPVAKLVPTGVAVYAREATRCYLYGFFPASLILCRVCVESGAEDSLKRKGLRKDLNSIPSFNRIQAMLDLALRSEVLDKLTFEMANQIRRIAGKAAHGEGVSETESREGLEQTRAILQRLYE
jgi:hypothetical protein